MEIKSRELSKEDFFQLFQTLKPQPIKYFNLFLAITAALLVSAAVKGALVHLYAQHQMGLAQQAMQTFNDSLTQAQQQAERQAIQRHQAEQARAEVRVRCFALRREYAAEPSLALHAAMAQTCTKAGINY